MSLLRHTKMDAVRDSVDATEVIVQTWVLQQTIPNACSDDRTRLPTHLKRRVPPCLFKRREEFFLNFMLHITKRLWNAPSFLPRCMECQRGLATRKLSVRYFVRLSVRPSVKRVIYDKFLYSYTTWKIIYPTVVRRRTVGGGDPFYLKFWVKLTPLEQHRRFSVDIRS